MRDRRGTAETGRTWEIVFGLLFAAACLTRYRTDASPALFWVLLALMLATMAGRLWFLAKR